MVEEEGVRKGVHSESRIECAFSRSPLNLDGSGALSAIHRRPDRYGKTGREMAIAWMEYDGGWFRLLVRQEAGEVQSTELDQQSVQALLFSASHALGSQKAGPAGDPLMQPPMIDAEPVALSTGSEEQGRAVLTVELPLMPPMRFRFDDDMARGIVENFREILDAPMVVRCSVRAN
ncbi:hypothetical protein ACRAWG_17055 [Methylobacterium sp. P31]